MRLHPSIIALKEKVASELANDPDHIYDIDLTYLASRGRWYFISWKGSLEKSGSIATNIGVHFFDMLIWIFGPVQQNTIHIHQQDVAAGLLSLKHAKVRWFLSVNEAYLPNEALQNGLRTFRSITVDRQELEFSGGFTDLHTHSYQEILEGRGFGLKEAIHSIKTVYHIRTNPAQGLSEDSHPFCRKVKLDT